MDNKPELNDHDLQELIEVLRKNDAFWALLLVSTIFATADENERIIEEINRRLGEKENDTQRSG